MHGERRQRQERVVTQHRAGEQTRRHAREHHRAKRFRGEVPKDQFEREEGTGQGSVEGGGDATGGSARDEHLEAVGVHARPLAEAGADGRTDLDDGSLPAHRSTAADAQGGGERFDQRHARRDPTAALGHGVHDLGDTVPLGLRGEAVDERPVDGTRDHRREEQEPHPQPREVRAADATRGGEVIGPGEQPRDRGDEPPEGHTAQTGAETDDDRERDEGRALGPEPPAQRERDRHRSAADKSDSTTGSAN